MGFGRMRFKKKAKDDDDIVPSKYKNKRTIYKNIVFDSKAESDFYKDVELSEDIEILKLQPEFELQPKFEVNGKKYRAINYKGDYKINKTIFDVKGFKTSDFKLKEKMFLFKFGNEFDLKCVWLCPKKLIDNEKIKEIFYGRWATVEDLKNARPKKIKKIKDKDADSN